MANARYSMSAAGVNTCIMTDDQFAVIPRQYCEGFMRSMLFFNKPPAQSKFSDSPIAGWSFKRERSGSSPPPPPGVGVSPRKIRQVCYNTSLFLEETMPEKRLTTGLLLNKVPVEVAPFKFRLVQNGQIREMQFDPQLPFPDFHITKC